MNNTHHTITTFAVGNTDIAAPTVLRCTCGREGQETSDFPEDCRTMQKLEAEPDNEPDHGIHMIS